MLIKYLNERKYPCVKSINGTDYHFDESGLCEVDNEEDAASLLSHTELFAKEIKDEPEDTMSLLANSVKRRGRPKLTE